MKKFLSLLYCGLFATLVLSCTISGTVGGGDVPSGVTASQDTYSNKIRIEWQQVTGADSYKVYRSATQTGSYQEIAERTVLFYDDTNVSAGDSYYYQVTSIIEGSESTKSTPVMGSVLGSSSTVPSAPSSVSATDGSGTSVTVSWTTVSAATSYSIWRATSSTGTYSEIGTSTTSSYEDTNASADTYYYYKVKSVNDAGSSDLSTSWALGYWELNPAPSSVTISEYRYTDKINVDWYLSSSPATNYNVYRSDSSNGTFTLIGSTNLTEFDDTTVTAGQVYWYAVTTVTSNGESLKTEPEWGAAASSAPSAPTYLSISGSDASTIDLVWDQSGTEYGYLLYSSTSASGPWDSLFISFPNTYNGDTNDSLDFIYDDLIPGTNYYFMVVATNGAGASSGTVTSTSGALTVVNEDGSEPNETTGTATAFGNFGTEKTLSIDNVGGSADTDYIAFSGTSGNDYTITLTYPNNSFSSELTLYQSGFSSSFDYIDREFGSGTHTINFSCTTTDTYYVKVEGFLSYNAGDYQLNITQQ